jgi:hypothetical protein
MLGIIFIGRLDSEAQDSALLILSIKKPLFQQNKIHILEKGLFEALFMIPVQPCLVE